jgi:hypothetical protein
MRPIANRNSQPQELTLDKATKQLALIIKTTVDHCLNHRQGDASLDQPNTVLLLLVALDAAIALEASLVRDMLAPHVAGLDALSESLSAAEVGASWKIQELLATYLDGRDFFSPLDATWHTSSDRVASGGQIPRLGYDYFNLVHYVDVAIQNMDEPQKLATLNQLVSGPEDGATMSITRCVAVYRVLEKLDGKETGSSN